MEEIHSQVKAMMDEELNISKEARVVIVRVWSDGFEAHQIKGQNDFNNLQLFTLTLRAHKGRGTGRHTLPFALCFKKSNHHAIFIQLLKEVRELFVVKLRYWGRDKQYHQTIVAHDMVSNDLPERCSNTCTSLIGLFTHRWGYSCRYNDGSTPSCSICELNRIECILKGEDEVAQINNSCNSCSDWWCPSRDGVHLSADKYPVEPGALDASNVPCVELSFKLLNNSIEGLQDWCQQQQLTSDVTPKDYLQRIGLSAQLVPGLAGDIVNGVPAQSSQWYPAIFAQCESLGIEMKRFGTMPMHMCFLGVEKSLLSKTKLLVNRRNSNQNKLWHDLTAHVQRGHNKIRSMSIDWCLSMAFSAKEDPQKLDTANWKSEHYLAFTRLSLFHFGVLDRKIKVPKEREEVILAFRRLRVVWFCLIANIFSDDSVPSDRIDNYVKLFLSSCRAFWIYVQADVGSTSRKKRKSAECSVEINKSVTKKTKKAPFFTSGSNYLSLLNICRMIEYSGDMRDSWEGDDESYIQHLKREIPTMRGTVQFLTTILRKLLRTAVFSKINKDNPFSSDESGARTQAFKIYKLSKCSGQTDKSKCSDPTDILVQNDVVVGVIGSDGNMVLCFGRHDNSEITTYPVIFDDSEGHWCYNLWFSTASLGSPSKKYQDRKVLLANVSDIFLLLRPTSLETTESMSVSQHRTVVCRSWKVRDESGDLNLPVPHKAVLLMEPEHN